MQSKTFYITILFVFSALIYSQSDKEVVSCGTEHGLSLESYVEKLLEYQTLIQQQNSNDRDMDFVRVQFHIVRPDNGVGGLDEEELWPVLEIINADYISAGLQFYHPDVVNEIWSSQYFICDNDSELNTLRSIYNTPDVLDIFIVNSATSGDTPLCGISTFTFMSSSYQGIVITESCWDHETGSHEVGHYFDLYHTHQTPSEYVDGTQCTSRGDGLCDTPADPDLSISGNVNTNCQYTGTSTDGHGDLYDGAECMAWPACATYGGPDAANIMNYNLIGGCEDWHFTDDQNEKMIYIATTYRSNYLVNPNYPFFQFNEISYEEINGDLDQVINPGELVELSISLGIPDYWPVGAEFVDVVVTTEEEYVEIANEQLFFEDIDPGDIFGSSDIPVTIFFDSSAPLGVYEFNIFVLSEQPQEFSFTLDVSLNQYGFPVYDASQKTSPLAVDFDNDGEDEIIYGDYNGFIHVLNSDGSELVDDTFPFDTGNQVWGAMAGADMDGDGFIDIAVVSKSKHFYLLDINGLKMDFDSEKYLIGTPAIGNLDGDADLEVVFSGYSSGNMVWALNVDGSAVDGFPLDLGEKVKIGVALADFNSNGIDDIVVGTDDDYIHLFYDDGSEAPGFPFQVGDKIQSAPAILDVDGQKVIFVGSNDNNLYAVNSDGSLRFSVMTTNKVLNSPAFLDHNNTFYVFFSDDSGILYAVDTDGNALDGWPVDAGQVITKSVAFADLDNDGLAEIIAVTELTDVLTYNLNGSYHEGFPMDNEFPFTSAPIVMDMDGDGDLEILAGSVNSMVSIDVKSSGSSSGYWSMYRGNAQRTGYYDGTGNSECGAAMGDVTGDGTVNILDLVQVVNYILDLSSPLYECAADFNQDGTVNILDLVQIANNILEY